MNQNQFSLFAETSIHDLRRERLDCVKDTIYNEDEGNILNSNKSDYVAWVSNKYRIQEPRIELDNPGILREERKDGRLTKQEIVLCYPVAGNTNIFYHIPTSRTTSKYPAQIEDGLLKIDLLVAHRAGTANQKLVDRAESYLETHLENILEDIEDINSQLESQAENWFRNRRADIEKEYKQLDKLDVPVLDRDDVSETFAALEVEKQSEIQIKKPDPPETAQPAVDPVVPQEDSRKIVSAINDVGKNFEKHPTLFKNKSEEDLRDFVLFYLQPNFKGTASGETFNVSGKSDIMLQYEGEPLFVAECAIWRGKKNYLDKISQLHGYLRWRDSKAAIVLFVQDQAMEPVQEQIQSETTDHETVDELIEQVDETWYEFKAHVPGDEDREVSLSVLSFNIP